MQSVRPKLVPSCIALPIVDLIDAHKTPRPACFLKAMEIQSRQLEFNVSSLRFSIAEMHDWHYLYAVLLLN